MDRQSKSPIRQINAASSTAGTAALPVGRKNEIFMNKQYKEKGKFGKNHEDSLLDSRKVIAKGSYLAYYDKKPSSKNTGQKPTGVFDIAKISNIKIKEPKNFVFDYDERVFEMQTKTREEVEVWVICLKFLHDQKNREQETATSTRSASYFYNLTNTQALCSNGNNNRNSGGLGSGSIMGANADAAIQEGETDNVNNTSGASPQPLVKRKKNKGKSHKFANLDAKAYVSVMQESPKIVLDEELGALSEKALQTKGIWNYIKSIKSKTLKSRIMYGFLKKRSKGKIKYFNNRWFFLISSRPLNQEDFLNDPEILAETMLPPMIEFDVIYYYIMDNLEDASGSIAEIRVAEILKVEIKDMGKSSEEGHAFIIDMGKKLFHLNSPHRFALERWVEAIEIAMQTARERQLSIMGSCKNISQLVTLFDTNEDIVRQQIEDNYEANIPKENKKEWEDVDSLLSICSKLREDMLSTFDACLALKPPRTDIIELYMKVAHPHITEVLSYYWEQNALELNPYETLSLVDWSYIYFKSLRKFGVSDDSIENGYQQLCNAYARKIHTQITPFVINILKNERENIQIEEDGAGYLFTNAPYDIVRIFCESFEVVVAKRIKDLVLKVLKVFHVLLSQYQKALSRLLENDQKLQHDFLIAQCNNCFIFFELLEDLLQPIRDHDIATDDEIENNFSQRSIQQYFQKTQQVLLQQMTATIFKKKLEPLYLKTFLDLDMEYNLNESFKFFEDYAGKMSKQTSRQAWTSFLERTVLCYIQSMLNSSQKIRQKSSEEAIVKIKEDYEKIEYRFGEFMTSRSMKSGIEVLDDLVSFFESSPAFISVACEKLRKTHGPQFKIATVKAILNLRTDMTKEERALALKICTEILDSFKNVLENASKKGGGIFSNLDTTLAEKLLEKEEIKEKGHIEDKSDDNDEDFGMNIDDFLKEGGLDIDELANGGENIGETNKDKALAEEEEEKKQEIIYNTDADEKMSGYLFKSSLKTSGGGEGEDIFGMMMSSVGSGLKIGLKMFTDTIQIKQKKLFFAIKNGILYWYAHERAREAEKFIPIKDTKAIERNEKNPKQFYIIYKKKCYRLESEHEQMTLKWYNSLKQAKDNDSNHLDVNRYEKQKIFQKITGKSLFKDYELLLEQYEKKIHDQIDSKLQEYLVARGPLGKNKGNEMGQKKESGGLGSGLFKKAVKKESVVEQEGIVAKPIVIGDEENFIKNLPETATLMTKVNPSQIDLFSAAFGGEEAAHAQLIFKKLQQQAALKALIKPVPDQYQKQLTAGASPSKFKMARQSVMRQQSLKNGISPIKGNNEDEEEVSLIKREIFIYNDLNSNEKQIKSQRQMANNESTPDYTKNRGVGSNNSNNKKRAAGTAGIGFMSLFGGGPKKGKKKQPQND